ncbi:MAG TPA: glycosyltransferase, partial [Steroidobacteraceae bacterium]|nr:glycosyltransferase [Steroidobacteraceae bacterium]
RQQFLASFPQLRDRPFLLFLGRIHPKKGCDLLIKAFAAVASRDPELRLVIAGPDSLGSRRKLAHLVRHLGVEQRVIWTGMLRGDAKYGALRSAQAFVLPSHQENFGIAVAEALACGTPVLISNKVNIWREVLESGAGLVEEDSVTGTTAMLERWMGATAEQRVAYGRSALECFRHRFHIEAAARTLLATIEHRGARQRAA